MLYEDVTIDPSARYSGDQISINGTYKVVVPFTHCKKSNYLCWDREKSDYDGKSEL